VLSQASVDRGLCASGVLPGGLALRRRANGVFLKARRTADAFRRTPLLFAYALAAAEENAAGEAPVVTAPTCGSFVLLAP
jgi:L-serine dehydratase